MSDLTELYQSLILDHSRRPRNYGELPGANRRAAGHNPLCGDQLTVWLRVGGSDDTIEAASFVGTGCAISQASASAMTAAVTGKTRAEAEALFQRFHGLTTAGGSATEASAADRSTLGALAAFAGVARFPMRVKCATLAWHALRSALHSPSLVSATAAAD